MDRKMSQKPKKPKNEKAQDVSVAIVWQRLYENKNDDIENTFCYQLFEMNYFNEGLFLDLCKDIDFVLDKNSAPKENYKLLVWIISCIFRSVFSHFDKTDRYKINNFDAEISEKWGGVYLERLRDLLDKIFCSAVG